MGLFLCISTLASWTLLVVAQHDSSSGSLHLEEIASSSSSASGSIDLPRASGSSSTPDQSSSSSAGSGSATLDWIPAAAAGLVVVLGISLYIHIRNHRSQSASSLPVAHRVSDPKTTTYNLDAHYRSSLSQVTRRVFKTEGKVIA